MLATAGLAIYALSTGNNLVYMLLSTLLAAFVVDALAGAWNLRGLEVARALPPELYAGLEGRGTIVVRNRRRSFAAAEKCGIKTAKKKTQ